MAAAETYPPISDYALIGDCHGGALVSRDGSIDWCSFHRFVASPVFSRLLDWDKGGYFRIAPEQPCRSPRRYLPGTNVLETRFDIASGTITVTDFVEIAAHGGHPEHRLVRIVRCVVGEVAVRVEFEPRFDYGLTRPRVELEGDGVALVYGGADALVLQGT